MEEFSNFAQYSAKTVVDKKVDMAPPQNN